jgi:hypothetical protein
MQIITNKISLKDLKKMSENMFGGLVKAVVDIEQKIMIVDAEMHADEERFLLEEKGSQQEHLWGINLLPDQAGKEGFIEFDSMINMRPSWGNRTRGINDPKIREIIRSLVYTLVEL